LGLIHKISNLFYICYHFLFTFLLFSFVNSIAVRQYSDSSCTKLTKIDYISKPSCYTFVSTGSYFIRACNCTMIEYDIYNSALCFRNIISTKIVQQNMCLNTMQKISCYEESSSSNVMDNFVKYFCLIIIILFAI